MAYINSPLRKREKLRSIDNAHRIGMAISGAIGFFIFFSRKFTSPIFDASIFCTNRDIFEAIRWSVPTISTHCQQYLDYNLGVESDIFLLVDIWIALCIVISCVYVAVCIRKIDSGDILFVCEIWKNSKVKLWLLFAVCLVLSIFLVVYLFYLTPLLPTSATVFAYAALLHPYGTGAALHSLLPIVTGYWFVVTVVYFNAATIEKG